jgi:hypothetical protein
MLERQIQLLEEIEVFLRQISRMNVDTFLSEGADIHDRAMIYADCVEEILEEERESDDV